MAGTTHQPEVQGGGHTGPRWTYRWTYSAGLTAGRAHHRHLVHGTHTAPRHPRQVCGSRLPPPGTFCPGHGHGAPWGRRGLSVSAGSWAGVTRHRKSHCGPLCPPHHSSQAYRQPPSLLSTHTRLPHSAVTSSLPPGGHVGVAECAREPPALGGSLPGPVRAGKGRQGSQPPPPSPRPRSQPGLQSHLPRAGGWGQGEQRAAVHSPIYTTVSPGHHLWGRWCAGGRWGCKQTRPLSSNPGNADRQTEQN